MKKSELKRLALLFLFLMPCLLTIGAEKQSANDYDTKAIQNIVYKKVDNLEIKLNLFLPVRDGKQRENAPLLIHLSSGCWYSGQPGAGGSWRAWRSVEKGFAVADVAHRSVGDGYAFPAQIEDVKAAVRFLRAHSGEYGIDPNRVAVMGFSSGGHLASMLGIPDKFKLFDVGENLNYSSQVNCVINFFSTSDITFMLKNSPRQAVDCIYLVLGAKKVKGKTLQEQASNFVEISKKFSPINYVNKDFSPTLTFQGLKDPIVPASQSCMFAEALRRAGVRSDIYIGNNGVHSAKSIADNDLLKKMTFDFLNWK